MRFVSLPRLVTACCLLPLAAKADNLDFESSTAGQTPLGWHVEKYPADADVTAVTDTSEPHRGHASATMTIATRANGSGDNASIRTTIDITPYRGKIVLFRAAMRTTGKGGAWMWIRAEGPFGFRHIRVDTPILNGPIGWKTYAVVNRIPEDADKIVIALAQQGQGASSIDDVSLTVVDPAHAGFEAPRPLSTRGLENLVAFTRLFGYVRFFHPSDEAARADWNNFAIAGVQVVERAQDARELAGALRRLFLPLAPTLRIFPTGAPAPPPSPALNPMPGATLTVWRHQGVFLGYALPGNGDTYSSARVTASATNAPFAADLGGGVSILMPTTLYRDAQGTLPHKAGGPVPHPDKPASFTPYALDRATRLADVVLSWTVFQHFYPDFVEEPADWNAVLNVTLEQAARNVDERAFTTTLRKMTAALRDGHAQVFAINLTEPDLPVMWDWIEGRLVVIRATSGSGLRAGDVVDRIDGEPVAAWVARIEPTISASTPQWKQARLQWYLKRQNGAEPVTLEVERGDGSVASVTLAQSEEAWRDLNTALHKPVFEVKPGIWYVDLALLTDADFYAAIPSLAQAKGIVFDMRGYPTATAMKVLSHLSSSPIGTPQWHIPITTLPDRAGVTSENGGWQIPPVAPHFPGRIVFMAGGGSVSFAEEVTGIVRDNRLATIVGSTTAGTDGNVNPFSLPGGYTIQWTGMRVLNLDGSRFTGIGIPPDVPVAPTIAGIRAGRDEVLERALVIAEGR